MTSRITLEGSVTLTLQSDPGVNYAKAQFDIHCPKACDFLRAVVVLVPGHNDDGRLATLKTKREEKEAVASWQEFSARHGFALVGCYFEDVYHPERKDIEKYSKACNGSGQALLDYLVESAGKKNHPELANAPLLLWGFSAGGQFNYEFVAWKPERVLAFVVNKGGIYWTALAPEAARKVPGILIIGEDDEKYRKCAIEGLFEMNHHVGAKDWELIVELGEEHTVGKSHEIAMDFFERIIQRQFPIRDK